MVALASTPNGAPPLPTGRPRSQPTDFLCLLPTIGRIARHAFRRLPRDQREEAIQEVIANCFVSYVRLVRRGRQQFAFASPLARFAIRHYRDGRRIGSPANRYDVTSPYSQRRNAVAVELLFQRTAEGRWEEIVVEDRRSTPAEIAATRIDFAAWLKQLDRKRRRAARLLAGGAETGEAAAQLGLSAARVSQLRQELRQNWCSFQGEATDGSFAQHVRPWIVEQ